MDDHDDPAAVQRRNDARLVKMANQIGTFFAGQPSVDAPRAVAAHLNDYWSPPMRARLIALIGAGAEGLRPEVAAAQALIRPPGARATEVADVPAGVPPTREGAEGPPLDPAWPSGGEGSDAG